MSHTFGISFLGLILLIFSFKNFPKMYPPISVAIHMEIIKSRYNLYSKLLLEK